MLKNFVVIAFLVLTTSCGFSPVHSSNYSQMELEGVKVVVENHLKTPNKIDILLKNYLEDSFNPENRTTKPNYKLDITLNKLNTSYEIQSNTVNLRTRVTLAATFKLIRLSDLKVILEDKSISIDSFEDSDSPYATLISDEETANKMAQGLSQEIKLRIIGRLKASDQ